MNSALLFSFGVLLIYFGLIDRNRHGRFYDDLAKERKRWLINLLKPLKYLGPIQYFLNTAQKSYSTVIVEEMLLKAGYPLGLKAGHVIMAKLVLPLVMGGGFLLLYGFQSVRGISGSMPVYLIFLIMVSAYFLPTALLSCLVRFRTNKVAVELGLFTEVVFMCLKAKLGLREALEEAAKTTDYLRPYLMICLNEWLNDRMAALNNLKRNVGTANFQMVIELLTQVAVIGDEKIADYLKENKRMEDELKNLEISAKSKIKPLILTVQLALPFIVILMVLFYPLVTQVEQLMNKI